MTHDLFLDNTKFDLISIICMTQFFSQISVSVLINDPQKKEVRASTRTYDLFFDNKKIWPNFIDMGHRAWHTFAKLTVCALINDLKKKFRKKLYVTIPQWSEVFRNMSHLWSGWNWAKCGLQLNDPIDWFKLCVNQPKNVTVCKLPHPIAETSSKLNHVLSRPPF